MRIVRRTKTCYATFNSVREMRHIFGRKPKEKHTKRFIRFEVLFWSWAICAKIHNEWIGRKSGVDCAFDQIYQNVFGLALHYHIQFGREERQPWMSDHNEAESIIFGYFIACTFSARDVSVTEWRSTKPECQMSMGENQCLSVNWWLHIERTKLTIVTSKSYVKHSK